MQPVPTNLLLLEWRKWLHTALLPIYGNATAQHVKWLIEWSMGGKSWWQLPNELTVAASKQLESAVSQLLAGEVFQRVIGSTTFRQLDVKIFPNVFIPRPETELLVENAIRKFAATVQLRKAQRAADKPIIVLDLCSGSGVIAISLAKELPELFPNATFKIFAVEKSPEAIAATVENAARNHVEITVLEADIRYGVPGFEAKSVDLIVSNPPYIPPNVDLPQNVLMHDPHLALFGGGEQGMELPAQVIALAAELLVVDGLLLMEHDDTQGEATRHEASKHSFSEIETLPDLNGRDRFLYAKCNKS
ncbi:peptide chain release factor N(5)-glutamine methyltransferase [Boudabousia tangfeifanii]|nr:peptide chain release factor N(5)-glutamine methyltransferase [Boudabousia tangfeifanii]